MKIKKFALTKDEPKLTYATMPDVIANDLYYPQEATIIKINLIEIKQVNPSDVILVVRQDAQELLIPLCLYKAEMIFMNDRYCWNTKEKEEFKLSLNKWSITIEGEAEEFSIDFYYSTDQKKPYTLLDKDNNRFFR
jgi:hypothetical protein